MIDHSNREAARAAMLASRKPDDIRDRLDRIEAKLNALYNLFALHEPVTGETQIPAAEDPDF